MDGLFWGQELSEVLDNRKQKMSQRIEEYSDNQIMANDLEVLADNCYEGFYINQLQIGDEDQSKRSITRKKILIKSFIDESMVSVDGYSLKFYYPYSGEQDLFYCKASTFSLGRYPKIEIGPNYLCFAYECTLSAMKDEEDKGKLLKQLDSDLSEIKRGTDFVNKDVIQFNTNLRSQALKMLTERREKIKCFYDICSSFEVSVNQTSFAQTHLTVRRRIVPIADIYANAPANYYIADQEYSDILSIIHHNCCTYERTPKVFKDLREEDIRNLLLASLNGIYEGSATGEAFRNKGKTDICIEKNSRAAFIAECKIWRGEGSIQNALEQLDGYLTWRDCKTALVYFVRNRDFLRVIGLAKDTLERVEFIRQVKETSNGNEFNCIMLSKSNPGQQVKVKVMLYNLSFQTTT